MPDIFSTTDVTVYDANGNPIGVINDNGVLRLAVDTKITSVSLGAIVNEANIFQTKNHDITSKAVTTIDTYTVPTGKKFLLTAFQVNADHPTAINVILRINGVNRIIFYLDPSYGSDQRALMMASPAKIGNAGDVITIVIEPTMPRGEVTTILAGIETNA